MDFNKIKKQEPIISSAYLMHVSKLKGSLAASKSKVDGKKSNTSAEKKNAGENQEKKPGGENQYSKFSSSSTGIYCRHFQKGNCRRINCSFKHEIPDSGIQNKGLRGKPAANKTKSKAGESFTSDISFSQVDTDFDRSINTPEKIQQTNESQFYCTVCSLDCKTVKAYQNHVKGMMHAKRVESQKSGGLSGSTPKTIKTPPKTTPPKKDSKPATPGKSDNPYYCTVCNIDCNTQKAYQNHTRGLIHTQRVMETENIEGKHVQDAYYGKQSYQEPVIKDAEKTAQGTYVSTKPSKDNGEFYCEVCDCSMTGEASFSAHMDGARHIKNVRNRSIGAQIKKGRSKAAVSSFHYNRDIPGVARAQKMVDEAEGPLIGLQHITEFVMKLKMMDTKYVCNLCNNKCDINTIISHVSGTKHRLNYMKEHFMNYYTQIRQRKIRKIELSQEVEGIAREIEQVEGRLKIKVKYINSAEILEKNAAALLAITDRHIDRDLSDLERKRRAPPPGAIVFSKELALSREPMHIKKQKMESLGAPPLGVGMEPPHQRMRSLMDDLGPPHERIPSLMDNQEPPHRRMPSFVDDQGPPHQQMSSLMDQDMLQDTRKVVISKTGTIFPLDEQFVDNPPRADLYDQSGNLEHYDPLEPTGDMNQNPRPLLGEDSMPSGRPRPLISQGLEIPHQEERMFSDRDRFPPNDGEFNDPYAMDQPRMDPFHGDKPRRSNDFGQTHDNPSFGGRRGSFGKLPTDGFSRNRGGMGSFNVDRGMGDFDNNLNDTGMDMKQRPAPSMDRGIGHVSARQFDEDMDRNFGGSIRKPSFVDQDFGTGNEPSLMESNMNADRGEMKWQSYGFNDRNKDQMNRSQSFMDRDIGIPNQTSHHMNRNTSSKKPPSLLDIAPPRKPPSLLEQDLGSRQNPLSLMDANTGPMNRGSGNGSESFSYPDNQPKLGQSGLGNARDDYGYDSEMPSHYSDRYSEPKNQSLDDYQGDYNSRESFGIGDMHFTAREPYRTSGGPRPLMDGADNYGGGNYQSTPRGYTPPPLPRGYTPPPLPRDPTPPPLPPEDDVGRPVLGGADFGSFIGSLSKCMVNSEEEASMALQVSNALTQALISYRVKNAPRGMPHGPPM